MSGGLNALIFDMDGVLINSEHLWRRAMIKGFAESGMILTEQECRETMGMRFREVIELWLKRFEITKVTVQSVEKSVLDQLLMHIEEEGAFIPGVEKIISYCREKNIKMGLATSSSVVLMDAIIKKLNLASALHTTVSAEHMVYGKPHPEVFLTCAEKMGVLPQDCLVIEDSLNGVISAKSAQMEVIAVPDEDHFDLKQFALADHKCRNMAEALAVVQKRLTPAPGKSVNN